MDERKNGYYFFKFLGDDEWTIVDVHGSNVGLFYDADGYGISHKHWTEGEWGNRIALPHENDDLCGDCLKPKGDFAICPDEKCPGRLYDNCQCPNCETVLTGKHLDYCKKCKSHIWI